MLVKVFGKGVLAGGFWRVSRKIFLGEIGATAAFVPLAQEDPISS